MKISSEKVITHLSKLSKGNKLENVSLEEDRLARRIHQLILSAQANKNIEIEEDDSLVFEETEEEDSTDVIFEPYSQGDELFTHDYIRKVIDFVERENPTFKRLNHHFRRVKQWNYVARFKNYLIQQGTMRDKLLQISKYAFERFKQSRDDGVQIHDRDIKRWAIDKARSLDFHSFKASSTWIHEFKSKNKIASRKVTKFVTVTGHKNQEDIEKEGVAVVCELEEFLEEHKDLISHEDVFNTDESGLNYEQHGARTLSIIGEKNTEAIVASMHATTHSYTVMPLISMDGKMHSPALLCLQEKNGAFGPQVEEAISRPPNLYICCSKSGKLDKRLLRKFMLEVYDKVAGPNSVLLIDSWSAHKDESLFHLENKNIKLFHIPEGATKFMQPLDVYCFHQWKDFIKRLQERIIVDRLPVTLHQRNNIINMNALILIQFQSSLFIPMLKYAWSKSGFNVEAIRFEGLKEICFEFDSFTCSEMGCCNGTFIQCSWPECRKCLCVKCFLINKHYHG